MDIEQILCGIPVYEDKKSIVLITPNMTLRDWFAGQALIGLASNWRSFTDDNALELLGKSAYVCADAMLAEREGEKQCQEKMD
jgi:hypothetical protein